MITDEEVVEWFAKTWIEVGGTSDAFDALKGQILRQILELEVSEFGIPLSDDPQANLPPLPPLPPFAEN